ncbi:MAG: hypothetical protein AB1656_22955 [Candidatus Omnitrophota bacterium]
MALYLSGIVFFVVLLSSGAASATVKTLILPPDFRCATCDYLREQEKRIRLGQKPIVNPHIVPEDFWIRDKSAQPADVADWPDRYYYVDKNRTDSDGDGLMECRYKLDFSRFAQDGYYSASQQSQFEDEFRHCVALYNNALKRVGLEFVETTGADYHILIQATVSSNLGSGTGVATLFGAWYGDNPICQFRSTYPDFMALRYLLDNGAPKALYKNPAGSPYVYVYSVEDFRDANGDYKYPVDRTMLHEVGHLLGLHHPFESLYDSRHGAASDFLVDWLAWPQVGNPPPAVPSTMIGGEDFAQTRWSRGFINSYMTYDFIPSTSLFPDIPPPIKAFIAHYYGIFNPSSAQVLLDDALSEHKAWSPLENGAICEIEPNGLNDPAASIQIGQPVLGALSDSDPENQDGVESYLDTQDWYAFQVASADAGRRIDAAISIGSMNFEGYRFNDGGISYNGNCMIAVYLSDQFVAQSQEAEFPSLSFTPAQAGIYKIVVRNPPDSQYKTKKDYILTVDYADGLPFNAPTFTPTFSPNPTVPLQSPTPVPIYYDYDLQAVELFLVIDDGGGSYDDDMAIDNPAPGQSIRFRSKVKNVGGIAFSSFGYEVYVDGKLYSSRTGIAGLDPGWSQSWRTSAWNSNVTGFHTLEWKFTLDGDENPSNNSLVLNFPIGNIANTATPTPSFTPTPSYTPTITFTSTPVPSPTPTKTYTAAPTPSPTLTPTRTPLVSTPVSSPTSASAKSVQVFDGPDDAIDLTGSTDYDPSGEASLTVAWKAGSESATSWDIYVRKGFGGPKFLARVSGGSVDRFVWTKGTAGLADPFKNGPDFNAAYAFRVIRLDDKLTPDDFLDQAGYVGLNLDGGSPVVLSRPAMPNLGLKEIAVYDDILGGNNLAPTGKTGVDADPSDWRAIQIAWNFGADAASVQDYRIMTREAGQEQFAFIGQTNSGSITYFWWTQNQDFSAAAAYANGPQHGKTYQFRVVKFAFDGSRDSLDSGWLNYSVSQE